MGKQPKLTPLLIKEARERHEAGEAAAAIARSFAVSRSTISRILGSAQDEAIGFIESPGPLPLDPYIRQKLRERASSRKRD